MLEVEALKAEKASFTDKLKALHSEVETLQAREAQWLVEKATLSSELTAAQERITKLELVKMTKHHLEVFQTLKRENKSKAQEIAALRAQLALAVKTPAPTTASLEEV
jgi:hypothetical protein